MMIGTERDAREFVASWVATEGRVRPGILAATVEGLTRSLGIMDSAPGRYAASEREDMRGALRYLERVTAARTCRKCGSTIELVRNASGPNSPDAWVVVSNDTGDGLTYCPPDPDAAKVGDHLPAAAARA